MKIAAVFAGQGAQYPGMGKSLYDISPAARAVFDTAGEIAEICFHGSAEALKETATTQPAVYAVDMAAWAAFEEASGCATEMVGMAGFSLGEYAALTAADLIKDTATGFELVKNRGRLMAASGRHSDGSPRGAMAAVLGKPEDVLLLVTRARGEQVLEAVNFNAPTQTVIAGDTEAIARFGQIAKELSIQVKVLPLAVSTAFHSPLMDAAAEGFADIVKNVTFSVPAYPVYLNLTGESFSVPETNADLQEKVRDIMTAQLRNPVYWQKTIENLVHAGAEAIIEFGPGKTLSGLTKKIAPGILALHVEDEQSLQETCAALA